MAECAPLIPNATTMEAMRAARRGELISVGDVSNLLVCLNADDSRCEAIDASHRGN